jgi:hypothetical protein
MDGGHDRAQPTVDGMGPDRPMLKLSDVLRATLAEDGEQLVVLMVAAIHIDTVVAAMHYIVWENSVMSRLFIRELLRRLLHPDSLMSVLEAFTRLLSLEDTLQSERIDLFLGGDAASNTRGFLALAEQLKESHPRKTYLLIKRVVELSHQIDVLGVAIRNAKESVSLVAWLEGQLRRDDQGQNARGTMYRSNEDEQSRYFLRTKSANETLLRAKEIRTDLTFSHVHQSECDDNDSHPDTISSPGHPSVYYDDDDDDDDDDGFPRNAML